MTTTPKGSTSTEFQKGWNDCTIIKCFLLEGMIDGLDPTAEGYYIRKEALEQALKNIKAGRVPRFIR